MAWESGTTYEGDIVSMKFHGQGTLIHASGYKVCGSFKNGKLEGYGRLERGKHYYQGGWIDNLPSG